MRVLRDNSFYGLSWWDSVGTMNAGPVKAWFPGALALTQRVRAALGSARRSHR